MIDKKDYRKIQVQLQAVLAERFDDVTVQIGDDIHYRGTNVVVTSPAFEGLLPEQRFHHAVRAIPSDLYDQYLRHGVVWFELTPTETGLDIMRMPRSDDIAGQEDAILERLIATRFRDRFQATLGAAPLDLSIDDFILSRRLLFDTGFSEQDVTRACLFFIRAGAFCDAQVLADVLPTLTSDHVA